MFSELIYVAYVTNLICVASALQIERRVYQADWEDHWQESYQEQHPDSRQA